MQEAKNGKPERHYKFIVEFGLHCFTKGPNLHQGKSLDDFDKKLHYSDTRETRIFCFTRYELSKELPAIAQSINQNPCYNTGKGNFFTLKMVGVSGREEEYEVYFKVSRERKGLLRLYVESAYTRDANYDSSQPAKRKINFFVIAHNIQANKPIKIQK